MTNISIIITPPKKNFLDFIHDNYVDKDEKITIYKEYLLETNKKKEKIISKKNKNNNGKKNKENNSIKISQSKYKTNTDNDIKNNKQIKNNEKETLIDFNKRLALLCNKRRRKEIKDHSETSASSISKFFLLKFIRK